MSCAASIEKRATQFIQWAKGRRNVCSNMFNVMISLLWLKPGGWVLHKTTQLERSYRSWTLAAQVQSRRLPQEARGGKNWPCDIQRKTNVELCTDGGRGCSFRFFFSLLQRFIGQRSLTKLQNKQNSVNYWQTRLVVTCAWWVSDRVWWTFLILSLWCYFFEMFWEARSPPTQGSPVEPWQPNKWLPLQLAVAFDPWALSLSAERGCLRSLPGSITSFPPEQLKCLAV